MFLEIAGEDIKEKSEFEDGECWVNAANILVFMGGPSGSELGSDRNS